MAGGSHLANVLVRERTLQHFSDAVMNQRRQERVPDLWRLGFARLRGIVRKETVGVRRYEYFHHLDL